MSKSFTPVSEVLGDLDELNSCLGLARAFCNKELNQKILKIQNELIEIGGFLAGVKDIDLKKKTTFLEKEIKPLIKSRVKTFSRPGVNKVSSFLHLSRAVCRRLERRVSRLKIKSKDPLIAYFNLLSKLLFWLAKNKEEKL